MAQVRIAVRAKPGSSRTKVGGAYGPEPQLIVAVTAPAVDGKANQAVIKAVAEALEVSRRSIQVASGHTARSKVLAVDVADEDLLSFQATLDRLLSAS